MENSDVNQGHSQAISGFREPITIDQALKDIEDNKIRLPSFQRNYVWKHEKIEKLFDSLMQGYPINSMLFWKVKKETEAKWNFYRFINEFYYGAPDFSPKNEKSTSSNNDSFDAVIDGQQRLTSLRIGLYGKYAWKVINKRKNKADSYPQRSLYLNLDKKGGIEDDCAFFFDFKTDETTKNAPLFLDGKDDEKCLWFKVGCIVDLHKKIDNNIDSPDRMEKISKLLKDQIKLLLDSSKNNPDEPVLKKYLENKEMNKRSSEVILSLERMVFYTRSINYYEELNQNSDFALNIFSRINSEGLPIDLTDIIFALLVSNWKIDARNKIDELIKDINREDFKLEKKYIVKAFLYLFNPNVKTESDSFDKEFCEKLEKNWEGFRKSVIELFNLLKTFGLSSSTLTSYNATLPILYYLYHSGKYQDSFSTKKAYIEEREEINKWLLSSLLKQTFGGQSDSTLQQSRLYFTDDIKEPLKKAEKFDGRKLNSFIKKDREADDKLIDELLNTQYKDKRYAFAILSILYPNLDYSNPSAFHMDHIYAKNLYGQLPQEVKDHYSEKQYNSIINLQMLDSNENCSKNDKELEQWIEERCNALNINRVSFLEQHLIPTSIKEFSKENFPDFYTKRKELLTKKLMEVLI